MFGLDALGGREHLVRVGHVGGHDVRGATGPLDLGGAPARPFCAPRDEHHGVPAGRKPVALARPIPPLEPVTTMMRGIEINSSSRRV